MLELKNIKKDYILKGQEPVHALKGISLSFRQSEFVAILGPSGCGKTTLLNIVGGLDRYTSGDLIIEGTSTKKYKDGDWDTYRNHSIGFVFQSYNLIGHQSILNNVELALTIAGLDKNERRQRALEALEKVGLKGQAKKKPNQLSGGQMQRVAIARALVNNPEILLADEPTGALDSVTSIQIMDLLKEVAKDRLVIMVTHNPDLAYKYANRIVKMFDGEIMDDSLPFIPQQEDLIVKPKDIVNKGKKKQSSMSFFTALGLSFSNLLSKAKRTVLVAVAGSIGIFGVSTVLAASTGVRHYIDTMQDDMLSSYPLTIAEEAVDYSSLMTGLYSDPDTKIKNFDTTTKVGLNSMIDYLMDRYNDLTDVKTNVINDDLVQFVKEIPQEYISALSFSYGIDPTNNIFTNWAPKDGDPEVSISLNGLTQRYIAELKTVEGFSSYATYVDLFTDFMKLLPAEEDYILSQYDLLGNSHFPQNENEIMLVVESDTTLTDLVFAQLGFYQEEEVMNIAQKAIAKYDKKSKDYGKTDKELDDLYPYRTEFEFTELLGKQLTYFPHDLIYHYDDIHVRDYTDYSIVLQSSSGEEFYILQFDETYTQMLKGMPVFRGAHLKTAPFSYEDFFAVNFQKSGEKPTAGTFIGTSNVRSLAALAEVKNPSLQDILPMIQSGELAYMNIPETGQATVMCGSTIPNMFTVNVTETPAEETIRGYQYPAVADSSWGTGTKLTISGILRPKKGVSFGSLSRGVYYTKEFQNKYMKDAESSQIIRDPNRGFINHLEDASKANTLYQAYVTFNYTSWEDPDHPQYDVFGYASCLNGDLNSSFSSLLGNITGKDYSQENEIHFRSLCGLKGVEKVDESNNKYMSYEKLPEKMSIYPVNFANKKKVNKYLDDWNKKVEIKLYDGTEAEKTLTPEERDELTYTDTISLIINTINTMITIITTALVIFTSLSLVVSSFMIAVITYISVMERVKEIGVIRSLGGRKKDISRLFIAENLVTGFMSGLIGIGITAVVCLIINLVISPFGIPNIALLTLPIIGIMIALSIVLSVLAGLIPSMHASRQDPVTALRSE